MSTEDLANLESDNDQQQTESSDSQSTNGDKVFQYNREDNQDTETDDNTETENEIPEKFKGKSLEDVIKSYTELEKQFSQKDNNENNSNENTDNNSDESDKDLTDLESQNENQNQDENNKEEIDFEKIENDFLTGADKELSTELREKLKKSGQSDYLIKQFENNLINKKETVVNQAKEFTKNVYDKVGGRDNYLKLMNTVKSEIGEGEVTDFLSAVKSNNKTAVNVMLDNYINKFQGRNGITAEQGSNKNGEVFGSMKEYRDVMNTKKYDDDASYAKQMDDKAKRSGLYNL